MIEKKIIKEMNTAYLTITAERNSCDFEIKMFQYNDIKGFIPFQMEFINNQAIYRYQIAQMESIWQFYGNKSIDIMAVRNIFLAIASLSSQIDEFLLSVNGVLLDPDSIFINGDRILFCYYPGNEKTFNRGIRELMEYILEKLDHGNKETVMTAYGIYQKILKNSFTMETLIDEFFAGEEAVTDKKEYNVVSEDNNISGNYSDSKIDSTDDFMNPKKVQSAMEFQETKNVQDEIKDLEEELLKENIGDSIFAGFQVRKHTKEKKQQKNTRKGFNILSFKKKPQYGSNTLIFAEENKYSTKKETREDKTLLLNCRKLVSEGQEKDIFLVNTPLLIGSSTESEYVIDNPMISRKHAIITYEKGAYYVTDTGSTNGTFINGSRLVPDRRYELDNGDEISFANEIFRLV